MKAEIEDRNGRRVGSVEGEGGRQVIRDEYGSRQGTVEENLFGERVIRDKNGEKVGTAFKEFLGDEYNIYDKYGDRVGKTDSDILGKGVTIRDKYGSKRMRITPSGEISSGGWIAMAALIVIIVVSIRSIPENLSYAFSEIGEYFFSIPCPLAVLLILNIVTVIRGKGVLAENRDSYFATLLMEMLMGACLYLCAIGIQFVVWLITEGSFFEVLLSTLLIILFLAPSYLVLLIPLSLLLSGLIVSGLMQTIAEGRARRPAAGDGDKSGNKTAVLLGAAAVVIAAAVCLCLALKGGSNVTDDVDRVKSPISTPKETADPYDGLVVGDEIIVRDADDTYANMREGPGTEYDVIRRVPNGARAYLVEGVWDDAWTAVIYDGQMGWVRSYFIYDLRGVIRNYDNTGCNVRSGPGTDFDVIGYLYNGERVDAADVCDDHGWYCIDYGGREGWISGGFFHRLETVIYNAGNSGANFRSGPGLDYDVLAFIPNNTEVTPVDTLDEDEWVCVEYEGQFGWVNRQFVR